MFELGTYRCSNCSAVINPSALWYTHGMAKILLVDDHPDTCETLAKVLQTAGHDVRCVPNGKEALAEVLANVPDVVLLDLVMPEMDGPTFLEVVRSYLRLQSLPVVILTAFTDSPMIERARNLNVNTILAKGKATSEDIQKALEQAIVRVPS
jgi:two-component system OmpR family response regulator